MHNAYMERHCPNIDLFIWAPVIAQPPLCSLAELENGTYSLTDLMDFHEALLLRARLMNCTTPKG